MTKTGIFTIAMAMLFITACSKKMSPEGNDTTPSPQRTIAIPAPVANSFTNFSFSFFNSLQQATPAQDDIFVSPLSLHIALGMLANGATGATKAEILQTLQAGDLTQGELNAAYKQLLQELPIADKKVQLGLANSIWYRNDFAVLPDYLNTLQSNFDAQVTALPFVNADKHTINKWASDKTNGRIDKVLDKIKSSDVLFLLNALYFKGNWSSKFDKNNTQSKAFTLENGSSKQVSMMQQTDTFGYQSSDKYDVLQMPYGNGQFIATLLLPKNNHTISTVFNSLTATDWSNIQATIATRKVQVALPKFSLKQEFELNKVLENMGMPKAFGLGAELKNIHPTAPLFVSFVKQNTFLQVDEEGSEAAAVTTIGVGVTSVPVIPQFFCNRPFGFIISEKTSNTILFMGRIQNP